MFAEYVRGIIFFLVFASFIGIILPEGKYKNYINLVLGFIVMFLVFEPVSGLFADGALDRVSVQISQASVKNSGEAYEAKYQELIVDAFKTQMSEQVTKLVKTLDYSLISLDADIDLETGELTAISMELSKNEKKKVKQISVAPVKITESDDPDTESIKKIVSDFYQLPKEHIHVIIHAVNEQ